MPRKAKELSALSVKRLTAPGLHAVGGIAGLHLQVTASGARTWILRVVIAGKRHDIGLGGYPDVSLAEARERAKQYRQEIAEGRNPLQAKREKQSILRAATAAEITFEQAAKQYMNDKGREWKNPRHADQWKTSLEQYAYPVIGKLQVRDIQLSHVMKILEPIWEKKTETAARLRGRIENVLAWATVRKYRTGENPARWKGHLDMILATPAKIKRVEHFKALPADKIPAFMQELDTREGTGAKALAFLILTAARSGEVRGATWDEIDLEKATWTIPGKRMKADKEHRVPLSPEAIQLLKGLPRFEGVNYVFPAVRGGMLSDMTLSALLRRMKTAAVPHGFRSTFRDWVAEHTNYPNEVAEMALAHTIGNKVEAAYRRGDLLEKRKEMMNEWARFCFKTPRNKAS